MSEASVSKDNDPDRVFKDLSKRIADQFLTSGDYARLNEADLKEAGVVPRDQTMAQWTYDRLGFGRSIQGDSREELLNSLPAPNDSVDTSFLDDGLFTDEDETEIRLIALRHTKKDYPRFGEAEAEEKLVQMILDRAGIVEDDGSQTIDVNSLDEETRETVLKGEPRVFWISGEKYWGVVVPGRINNDQGHVAVTPSISEIERYIVVQDPFENGEITEHVLADPSLTALFMVAPLADTQQKLKSDAEGLVGGVAIAKHEAAMKLTEQVNDRVRRKLFDLCVTETMGGRSLNLEYVSRSGRDIENTDEYAERYYVGFRITQPANGILEFGWTGESGEFETVIEDGIKKQIKETQEKDFRVQVKFDDDVPVYKIADGDWVLEPDLADKSGMMTLSNFFRYFSIIQVKDYLDNLEPSIDRAEDEVGNLERENSLQDFLTKYLSLIEDSRSKPEIEVSYDDDFPPRDL